MTEDRFRFHRGGRLRPRYPANHLGEEVCRIYGYDVLAPKDSGGSGEIAGKYT